jgi:phosphomannomutase
MKKIVLFDMDGTLTPPRKALDTNLLGVLTDLTRHAEIGIVSGSDIHYIMEQCRVLFTNDTLKLKTHILPCNGTKYCAPPSYRDHSHKITTINFMRDKVGNHDFHRLMKIIIDYQNHIVSHYDIPLTGHFVSYRGSMINWCPIGRNATDTDRKKFSNFDKTFGTSTFRKAILSQLREEIDNLRINITVKLGGETSFDIFPDGWDKTFALSYFPDHEVYFLGDRCGENGNDKEIYDALQPNNSFWVKDTKDTKLVLETLLKEWK